MVTFKTNVNQFNSEIRSKISRLESQMSRTMFQSAKYVEYTAKLLAPKKTGKLVNSIKTRKLKKGYSVRVTAGQATGDREWP